MRQTPVLRKNEGLHNKYFFVFMKELVKRAKLLERARGDEYRKQVEEGSD